MVLGEWFEKFMARSPVSVLVRGTLERVVDPEKFAQVFTDNAVVPYTRALTLAQGVGLRSDVVFRIAPSVGAWDQAQRAEMPVTRQAGYAKVQRLALPLAAGLGEDAGRELGTSLRQRPTPPPPLLPGSRGRVLEGNPLAGTEPRRVELRRSRAAALPGQARVFSAPQREVLTAGIPGEAAYAQERARLPEVVPRVAARDGMGADRNFCPTGVLFGGARRGAVVVIRQHGATVVGPWQGQRRAGGRDARGQVRYDQALGRTETATGALLVGRRITVELPPPPRQGETEMQGLTNLPPADAAAKPSAALDADRWPRAVAFEPLTLALAGAVATLGSPKAALFGVCGAGGAYNVLAVGNGTLRAAQGAPYVEEQLSRYDLTLEVAQVAPGRELALGTEPWGIFQRMSTAEVAAPLGAIATPLDTEK